MRQTDFAPNAPARPAYRQGFRPRSLPATLVTGLIIGLIEVFFALSFASLIFHDTLSDSLPRGMGLALVSSAAALIGVGLTSSQPGVFSVIQDVPAVLLAVIAGQIAALLSPAAVLPTVLALIAATSLFTGLALILIGQLGLSGLIRYMPYPVLGGFLAATGWLLVSGAFPIMTGAPLRLDHLAEMLQPDQLALWLPGVGIAAAVFLVMRFARHPLALPGLLVGSLLLYHLVLALTGTSPDRAAALGLFSADAMALFWAPPTWVLAGPVNWGAILREGGNIAVLAGMTLVGLLLNLSAMELVMGRELDINHELRTAGLANLVSGLAGGFIGYQVVSNTGIACRAGVRDRIAPVLAGLTCLAVALFQPPVLRLVPKALFAGLLLAFGFDFLYDWVILSWRRFARAEYLCVLLILVVILLTDYLTGVVVGLLVMVVLFTIGYSRVRVILRNYTVGEIFSTVERSEADSLLLEQAGGEALVYELQGFLFFGTANVLRDTLKQRLAQPGAPALALLLVDFRAVTGIDSSAALSFQKTLQLAEEYSIRLALTGASGQVRARLGLDRLESRNGNINCLPDLDHGLEWCEDQVLARYAAPVDAGLEPAPADVRMQTLLKAGLDEVMAVRAAPYLTECAFAAGDTLIRKGDPAGDLYILASGQVSIYQQTELGQTRVRRIGPGSIIGEMALYLNQPRTADVLVEQPCQALRMDRGTLAQIREEDPSLSAALHEMIAHQLAVRIRKDEHGLSVLRR